MDRSSVERDVLAEVVDRTGRGGTRKVRVAFEAVEARLAALGHTLRRPVTAEIVSIPIMGATTTRSDRHVLHVSRRAVDSEMLDGLLAHEMSHMVLTEAGHPSHDPHVADSVGRDLPFSRAGREVFGQAYNHVQDIYADDIAFLAGVGARAVAFFSGWIRGNASMRGPTRWPNVGLSVSNGFALGNLDRHGLLKSNADVWEIAHAFDEAAGLRAVDAFAAFYRDLPVRPTRPDIAARVREIVTLLGGAADSTRRAPFNTSPG